MTLTSMILQRLQQGIFLVIVFILSLPLLVVISSIFFFDTLLWQHLYQTVLLDYILNSIYLMLGVGTISLLLGVIPAWLVSNYDFSARRIFEWALLLPMAMPAYIISYTYTGLLDVGGQVQLLWQELWGGEHIVFWNVRSLGGAIIMLSLVLYPYVYLLARSAFVQQSKYILEVAHTLGYNDIQSFYNVALPLARPAIMVGLLLVLMETLADYGTVQYFGINTFTTGIFKVWFGLDQDAMAAQLSAVLLMFMVFLIILERYSRKQAKFHHTSSSYTYSNHQPLPKHLSCAAFLICFIPLLFGFILPTLVLCQWAIHHIMTNLNYDFLWLMINSFSLALISSILAMLVAVFVLYYNRFNRSVLSAVLTRIISLGYAIPGMVIAVGALLSFSWFDQKINQWFGHVGLLLSGSIVILVFAYLVRFLTLSIHTIEAGMAKIKPSLEEVAITANYKPLGIFRHVHLPLLKSSLFVAVLLVFVDVIKELPATLILRPFNFNTLAVRTYELANEERLVEAALPALAIVMISLIPIILLSRAITKSRLS